MFCGFFKKYIEFWNYSFRFIQTFSNPILSILQSETPKKKKSQKLIKLNKITIQNKKERVNRTHIKVKLVLNM